MQFYSIAPAKRGFDLIKNGADAPFEVRDIKMWVSLSEALDQLRKGFPPD